MDFFSWGALASLVINAVVSVLASWFVASIYFKKVTRAEKIADQIRSGLQKALLPIIHAQFFDGQKSFRVHPHQPPPKNQDIPFVEYALFSEKRFCAGQKIEVLLKLKDTGFDLDNPAGVSVRDHEGRALGVVPIGLGYAKVTLHISSKALPGERELTVDLTDIGEHRNSVPNRNVQTLPFVIEKELQHDRQYSVA